MNRWASRILRAQSACVCSVIALETAPALAVDIDSDTAAAVATSTVNGGAADDITITEDGSITIITGADVTAVTLDSDNFIENFGAISLQDIDGATGILINPGFTGSIYSEGTIEIVEDYTRTDDDDDGDDDGDYAVGSDRIGIHLVDGGIFTGNLEFAAGSSITVEGNESAGVLLESVLSGSLINDGSISVLGDSALGVGVYENITGNFLQSGSITATGLDASGIVVTGNIDGAFTNEGSVVATGFASTSTTNYADPDDLTDDDTPIEDRIDDEELLDNNVAVAIGANVGEGILINGVIDDFVDDDEAADETKDTIEDFDENRSTGSIASYGSGEALLISPDVNSSGVGDIVIGEVVDTVRDTLDDDDDDDATETLATFNYDYGLINRGSIFANGLNVGFEATALRIEGSSDGTRQTVISGGIENTGSIQATAREASSTAVSLGGGADIGRLHNDGSIGAGIATEDVHTATAIYIEDGANLSELVNTGSITASSVGHQSSAYAIQDLSGTLVLIENLGAISASYALNGEEDIGIADAASIDLSNHNASEAVTILQYLETPVDDINGDGDVDDDDVTSPSIAGNIRLGAGDDIIDVQAGTILGDIDVGAGDDTISLVNMGFAGDIDLGSGNDLLSIGPGSEFIGAIYDDAADFDLEIDGATVQLTNDDTINLQNLIIAGDATLLFDIDAKEDDLSFSRLTAAQTASIGQDVEIYAAIESFVNDDIDLILIEADSLTVEDGAIDNVEITAPAIYNSSALIDDTTLTLTLQPKTASELGLNFNESSAFNALLEVAATSDTVGAALTSYSEISDLADDFDQLLPDTTDPVTQYLSSQTSLANGTINARLNQTIKGLDGAWLSGQFSFMREEGSEESSGYQGPGFSMQGGYDKALGEFLNLGAAGSFRVGKFDLGESVDGDVETTAFDLTGYASINLGGFRFDTTGVIGHAKIYSDRRIDFGDEIDIYSADRGGSYYGGSARIGYEILLGKFFARPSASYDYFSLSQNDFVETSVSGDELFALSVGEVTTSRSTGTGLLTIGRRSSAEEGGRIGQLYRNNDRTTARTIHTQSAYFGFRSELDATPYIATAQFLTAGGAFELTDSTAYENALLFGLGLGATGDGFALSFNYDGELAEDFMAHRLGASFRLAF